MNTVADVFLLSSAKVKKLVCWNAREGGVLEVENGNSSDKFQSGGGKGIIKAPEPLTKNPVNGMSFIDIRRSVHDRKKYRIFHRWNQSLIYAHDCGLN